MLLFFVLNFFFAFLAIPNALTPVLLSSRCRIYGLVQGVRVYRLELSWELVIMEAILGFRV